MTTIAFPSGPTLNQTYSYNNRTWIYNGAGWARVLNNGQIASVFIAITSVDIPGVLPLTIGTFGVGTWVLLNYV